MLKTCFILLPLFLALSAKAQDTVHVELWDNQKIKRIKYFGMKDNHLIVVKDSLFYTDGTIWETQTYDASLNTMLLTRYDTNGKPELIIPLNEKGNMNGLYTKQYANGQRAEEGMYSDGKREGIWKYWYESGRPEKAIVFKMDLPIAETEWWENGHKRKEKDSTETIISYFENGQKQSILTNNKKVQTYTCWDEHGTKREESTVSGYEIILLNAWNEKGKQTLAKGNGYIDIIDGELGLPMRIYYKKGKRVYNP